MSQVVVLNQNGSFLSFIDWKKAFILVHLEKAEIVKNSKKVIKSVSKTFFIPKVIRLVKTIKTNLYSKKVPFSKRLVYLRDGGKCVYCGVGGVLTVDHVIPRSKGGKTSFENIVACCKQCNVTKDCKFLEETGMKMRKKPYSLTVMDVVRLKLNNLGFGVTEEDILGDAYN